MDKGKIIYCMEPFAILRLGEIVNRILGPDVIFDWNLVGFCFFFRLQKLISDLIEGEW